MEFEPGRYPGPAWHAETYAEEKLLLEYRRRCKPPAGTLATGLFHYHTNSSLDREKFSKLDITHQGARMRVSRPARLNNIKENIN
jgi:hypothetical protein